MGNVEQFEDIGMLLAHIERQHRVAIAPGERVYTHMEAYRFFQDQVLETPEGYSAVGEYKVRLIEEGGLNQHYQPPVIRDEDGTTTGYQYQHEDMYAEVTVLQNGDGNWLLELRQPNAETNDYHVESGILVRISNTRDAVPASQRTARVIGSKLEESLPGSVAGLYQMEVATTNRELAGTVFQDAC
jgi:hypothetical protein